MVQQSQPTMTSRTSVMVIGSGTRFMSGISQYTHALACAFSTRHHTSVVLMRRLLPRRFYPGADRVGAPIAEHRYPPDVPVYDGVDWFVLPSVLGAWRLMHRRSPNVIVLQWWTGAVAHIYLLLVLVAKLRRVRVVFEMHEMQDTGEARIRWVARYTRMLMRLLTFLVDGFVIHSEADRQPLADTHRIGTKPVEVIRHGPFQQYAAPPEGPLRTAPEDCVNLMFFGTIRPYKGLEDLVRAFDALPDPQRFWLTVVGETWEGWTKPGELIANSPLRDRITFVNRYVSDGEAARWLAGADALVLPYHRSSASGPLHVGMSLGLPIAVSDIPALVDAASGYRGCVFFPPGDVPALQASLQALAGMRHTRFDDPVSWEESVHSFERLFDELDAAKVARVAPGRMAVAPTGP
ncbi:glycosyltransferase [Mycobacterium sp. djl-10]|nr:glycosyltransferase [Mycobacterium sp. djl-10]